MLFLYDVRTTHVLKWPLVSSCPAKKNYDTGTVGNCQLLSNCYTYQGSGAKAVLTNDSCLKSYDIFVFIKISSALVIGHAPCTASEYLSNKGLTMARLSVRVVLACLVLIGYLPTAQI